MDNFNFLLASVPAAEESFWSFHTSVLQEDAVTAAPPPTLFQHQVVLDQAPVASGSNVSLPLPLVYDDIEGDDQVNHHEYNNNLEGDDYMAMNNYEYNDNLACDVLQRISSRIPEITPLQGYGNVDESGDYYGRGCDTFAGPQAKADDIDKFLIEAGNAQQFDGNAKLEQALEKLGLQSQYDLLPGMEVPLMPHQTIGVAWMIEKEKSRLRGGCLADDMGLGKVFTASSNRSKDPMCKTTLIIAPFALLDQWKLEIELKASRNLQCLIYHGSTKPKRKQDLLRYDVILTTYSTMALEWPDHENETKKQAKAKAKKRNDFIVNDSEDEKFRPKKKQEQGLLFQVEFFRIVLDEAQSIRNRRTSRSRQWEDDKSLIIFQEHPGHLIDVYGYLRFLQVRPWYDWEEFQHHIGSLEKRRPTLAVSRLQTIIATFLLRRMKDTTMDGKRLIELPERKVSLVRLQFSKEELDIYKTVEAGAQANFNRFLKAGTVLKQSLPLFSTGGKLRNYTQVLVLLLRLRQICSHPSLVQEGGAAFISSDPTDNDESITEKELSRAHRLVSSEFVATMKAKLKASSVQRMEAEKQSADATAEDEECPICFDAFTDAVVTPCTHVFCRECIGPTCRGAFCAEKLFLRRAFLPSDAELLADDDVKVEVDDAASKHKAKGRGKARPERSRKIVYSESYGDEDVANLVIENDDDDDDKDTPRFLTDSSRFSVDSLFVTCI
ncbi:hypothetical protein C0993_008278 [Termitomyces sp. T159_Od127]|nr:hypothetical protein C0993_008278 [Termitomyces sp. T159_Od127]